MNNHIRPINIDDAGEVLDIYTYYIEKTPVSFETEVPTIEEFKDRIRNTTKNYPWLVYSENNQITGYAYASQHRQRSAYRWSVDVTVYLDKDFKGKGIGSALYTDLLRSVKELGYYNAFAGITLPNAGSVAIHEKFGFKKIGEYHNVGFKFNKWYTVGWWQLTLQKHYPTPENPVLPQ